MNKLTVINHNNIEVVDSREVAEMIDKPHDQLMRSIRGYIEILDPSAKLQTADFFLESIYTDKNNQQRPCYLLTKQGCEMVANKMTGQKGVLFTASYVQAFNQMEKQLTTDYTNLPPELQMFKQLFDSVVASTQMADRALETSRQALDKVENIKNVISLDTTSWRQETTKLINDIATKLGGFDHIKDVREESYKLLNQRFGVDVRTRVTNKRRRMADEGICKSRRDKLTVLDVIQDDKKLIEGYVIIIKDMAIKYGVA